MFGKFLKWDEKILWLSWMEKTEYQNHICGYEDEKYFR